MPVAIVKNTPLTKSDILIFIDARIRLAHITKTANNANNFENLIDAIHSLHGISNLSVNITSITPVATYKVKNNDGR